MSDRVGGAPRAASAKWKKRAQSYLSELGMQFADTAGSLPRRRPAPAVKNKILAVAGPDVEIRGKTLAGKPLYFAVNAQATRVGRVVKVKAFTYTGEFFGGTKP